MQVLREIFQVILNSYIYLLIIQCVNSFRSVIQRRIETVRSVWDVSDTILAIKFDCLS